VIRRAGFAMPKACSVDLRLRVIEAVGEGASRREAAERFAVSVSSAVKWFQFWQKEGRCAPRSRGGSRSPLEDHCKAVLALVAERPDATLEELLAVMRKRGIRSSRTALWRFLDCHDITHKKSPARVRAATGGRRPGAPALDTRTRTA
jgi:transposase